MKHALYKLYLLTFISLTACHLSHLLFPGRVQAQALSLSISPPLVEVMIKPGKTIVQKFTLVNLADDTMIHAQIVPFDQNGLILDSLEKSVSFLEILSPKTPFILKNGQKAEIVLKINPSESTREQDYYQALIFRTTPQPLERSSQSSFQQTLSALILLTVTTSGQPKSAQISRFNLDSILDSFSPVTIDIGVKNSGPTFFHINGNLYLKGPLGEIKYPLVSRIHLSGQERQLLMDKKDPQKITGFFLGKYTLGVDFVLDQGNIKITKEQSFYAFPYKLTLVVVIALILLSFTRKKFRSKKALVILLLTPVFFSLPQIVKAQSAGPNTSRIDIRANLEYRSLISLYGFTSPNSIVRAESFRSYGHTISNDNGFFLIDNLAVSRQASEICLQTIDHQNRTSYPLCLPLSKSGAKKNIGPIILPPTLSLSHSLFFVNQKAYASGMSFPNSKITVSLFNNKSRLPVLDVYTDNQGQFSFTLPVEKASSWRIFAASSYRNQPTPKSQTLYFRIMSMGQILLIRLLPTLLWAITIIICLTISFIYNRRTGNISSLSLLIGKKLRAVAQLLRPKLQHLWHSLRIPLRLHRK